MAERGISVDHSTVHRWAIKLLPVLEREFRRSKHKVGKSLRMDETYIRVQGEWKYLYRAVDKAGATSISCCGRIATRLRRACFSNRQSSKRAPEKVTIDKSGSNVAALEAINAGRRKRIVVRQIKYLNNIVEQDHRASNAEPDDARLQGFSLRTHPSVRHRTHAHDQERANEKRRQGKNPAQNFYSLAA